MAKFLRYMNPIFLRHQFAVNSRVPVSVDFGIDDYINSDTCAGHTESKTGAGDIILGRASA